MLYNILFLLFFYLGNNKFIPVKLDYYKNNYLNNTIISIDKNIIEKKDRIIKINNILLHRIVKNYIKYDLLQMLKNPSISDYNKIEAINNYNYINSVNSTYTSNLLSGSLKKEAAEFMFYNNDNDDKY